MTDEAKIDAAAQGLSPEAEKLFRDMVKSWMRSHPGFGLPNLNGLRSVAISQTKDPEVEAAKVLKAKQSANRPYPAPDWNKFQ